MALRLVYLILCRLVGWIVLLAHAGRRPAAWSAAADYSGYASTGLALGGSPDRHLRPLRRAA